MFLKFKNWLIRDSYSLKTIYVWSSLGSIAIAASSFLLLVAVSQCLGVEEAGIFSIAFALAQQLICIGYFEVRVYQATDIQHHYHFSEYFLLRVLSCCIMISVSVFIAILNYNDIYKGIVIVLVCCLKCLDAFADVYETMFQQHERLDVSGKSLFVRTTLYTLTFITTLSLTNNLCLALLFSIIISSFCIFTTNVKLESNFIHSKISVRKNKMYSLFLTCLPLFICSFLCIYIINAPKYALDANMSSEFQTYFSILFFPASVLNLISGFLFKPLLTSIAVLFNENKIQELKQMMNRLFIMMIFLTILILVGAYFLGIPVLSLIYGISLVGYRNELLIIILGGAIYSLSVILYYIMVTARAHKKIMITYGITSIFAISLVPNLVKQYGLIGASLSYLILMIVLFSISYIMMFLIIKKDKVITSN